MAFEIRYKALSVLNAFQFCFGHGVSSVYWCIVKLAILTHPNLSSSLVIFLTSFWDIVRQKWTKNMPHSWTRDGLYPIGTHPVSPGKLYILPAPDGGHILIKSSQFEKHFPVDSYGTSDNGGGRQWVSLGESLFPDAVGDIHPNIDEIPRKYARLLYFSSVGPLVCIRVNPINNRAKENARVLL